MYELQQNADLIGQKIDCINAFNTVKRDILLKECYNNFPQIYCLANCVILNTAFCSLGISLFRLKQVCNKEFL